MSLLPRVWKYTFVRCAPSIRGDVVIGTLVPRWLVLGLLLTWLNPMVTWPKQTRQNREGADAQ